MWQKSNPIKENKPRTKSPEEALASLMRLCARAEKCEGDARRLMRRWGVDQQAAEEVLARLVRDRFIDDRRYATLFVREKLNLSGWGAYKIRTALKRKEVSEEIIREALAELDSGKLRARLNEQLKRKLRTLKAKTPYELKTKLIRYGLSLGYDYEAVMDAASQTLNQADTPCNEYSF